MSIHKIAEGIVSDMLTSNIINDLLNQKSPNHGIIESLYNLEEDRISILWVQEFYTQIDMAEFIIYTERFENVVSEKIEELYNNGLEARLTSTVELTFGDGGCMISLSGAVIGHTGLLEELGYVNKRIYF